MPQRLALTGSIHRGDAVDGLVVDGGEVTAEVDGGSIGEASTALILPLTLGAQSSSAPVVMSKAMAL